MPHSGPESSTSTPFVIPGGSVEQTTHIPRPIATNPDTTPRRSGEKTSHISHPISTDSGTASKQSLGEISPTSQQTPAKRQRPRKEQEAEEIVESSETPASIFHFLQLSLKARKRIYRFLLVNPKGRAIMDLAGAKRKPWSGLGANTAILRTFSVVRDEALEVLFKSNTFSIYLGGDHLSVDFEGGPRQLGYILTPGKAEQIFGLNYRRIARLSIDIRISPTHCGLILTHISDFLKSLSVKVIRYIISYPVKNNKEISPYSSESADIQHLIESRQGDFVLLGGLIVNLFLQIPITIKVFWGPRVTEEDADRLNGVGHVPERVILNILEKYQRLYFQSPHPVAELDSKRRVRYREDL